MDQFWDWITRPWLWEAIAIGAACLFYGRFYIQWIASELRGRSVVPIVFWYMSSVGSVLLLLYSVVTQSPNGALSHCFNIVVYSRNLNFAWRERGRMTPRRYWLLHGAAGAIILGSVGLLLLTLAREYQATADGPPGAMRRTWFWIGVGAVGQGLFALRFLIQWVVTEARKKSVIPAIFWHISLAAATLLMLAHLMRPEPEWIFVVGLASTWPIYVRNLWLIRRGDRAESPEV